MLDLLIIGGGPAGCSAALVAGRARLSTVVVDAGAPRNGVVDHTHGLLTRDGASPLELRRLARRDLARYPTVEVVDGRVQDVEARAAGFVLTGTSGETWTARRVLVASGWRDDLDQLGIPGLRSVYGRSVFPCPLCDGFEHAGVRKAVLLGAPTPRMGAAQAAHYLTAVAVLSSPDFVVFTHGLPAAAPVRAMADRLGVLVVEAPIVALHADDGRLQSVETADGRRTACGAGFVGGAMAGPSHDLLERLGVAESSAGGPWPVPDVAEDGRTSVPRLYVAGDARTGFGGLVRALAQGSSTAVTIVFDVAGERWGGH